VDRAIDELPLVALAASVARGTTIIRGAAELRVKESDRVRSSVEMVRALGGRAEELEDGMKIEGVTALRGGRVKTYGDHRIAMAALVAGLVCPDGVAIDDDQCIRTSFPGFNALLAQLGGRE